MLCQHLIWSIRFVLSHSCLLFSKHKEDALTGNRGCIVFTGHLCLNTRFASPVLLVGVRLAFILWGFIFFLKQKLAVILSIIIKNKKIGCYLKTSCTANLSLLLWFLVKSIFTNLSLSLDHHSHVYSMHDPNQCVWNCVDVKTHS